MTSEERLAQFIARSREARQSQASRVSNLITSIANGIPYEFDPANGDTDELPVTDSESGQLPESEGKTGTVVWSAGESNDPRPPLGTEEESGG